MRVESSGPAAARGRARRSWCVLVVLLLLAPAGPSAQTVGPRGAGQGGQAGQPRAGGTYLNPVFDTDFPDPTVIRASDGWFYAYATQTVAGGRGYNFQVARSRDLVRWERMPDPLPVKPAWASRTQQFWAPDVQQRGETFYMYYSAVLNPDLAEQFKRERDASASREAVFCLGVATSHAPAGPFDDSGRPMRCDLSFVNIDPMGFDDPKTGKKYLYWGSGFGPIKVQELSDDRLGFKEGTRPVDLIRADKNVPFQTLVEGAWVVERGGYYYLFYSGENCCVGPPEQIKYAVMVARSRSATGPFETLAEATGRPDSIILKPSARWYAPGHNSVITDAAGQDWIAYHAIDPRHPHMTEEVGGARNVRRVMLIDRVVYRDGWPHVEGAAPSTTRRPAPAVEAGRR